MQQSVHLNQLASQHFSLGNKPSKVALWVPSAQLNCFNLEPLQAPKKKWHEIIPWQLEDQLLEDPERYQIVWYQSHAKQPLHILAIPKAELNQWQLMAQANNVEALAMVPDCFALPINDLGWTVYVEGDQVIVRTANAKGFGCDVTFFWQLLERELDADKEFEVSLWSPNVEQLPNSIQTHSRVNIEQRTVQWETIDPDKQLSLLVDDAKSSDPITSLRPWRRTAILASLLVLATTFWLWIAGNYYQSSASALSRVVQRDYQQLFGDQLSSSEMAMDEGVRRQRLTQVQMRLFKQGLFAKMRDLDLALSRCIECELISLKSDGDALELVLNGPDDLPSWFVSLNTSYSLAWQYDNDLEHILTIEVKQGSAQ